MFFSSFCHLQKNYLFQIVILHVILYFVNTLFIKTLEYKDLFMCLYVFMFHVLNVIFFSYFLLRFLFFLFFSKKSKKYYCKHTFKSCCFFCSLKTKSFENTKKKNIILHRHIKKLE